MPDHRNKIAPSCWCSSRLPPTSTLRSLMRLASSKDSPSETGVEPIKPSGTSLKPRCLRITYESSHHLRRDPQSTPDQRESESLRPCADAKIFLRKCPRISSNPANSTKRRPRLSTGPQGDQR